MKIKKKFKINLQLFNDQINDIAGLDSLLDGNTTNTNPEPEPNQNSEPPQNQEPAGSGGDPSLESSGAEPLDDNSVKQQQAAQNAAFARMRTELSHSTKTIQQIAKALGIQETDPIKLGDMLVNLAQEKLAKEANVPVELYKELNSTKEQLAAVQYQQNQVTARQKFMEVKEAYGLDDKQLIAFAQQLDNEGLNAVTNPNIDLEYEYYRRNRQAIEEKKIAKAVEEALRKSNLADTQSTKPGAQQGGGQETGDKINNVSALNDLLDGKK